MSIDRNAAKTEYMVFGECFYSNNFLILSIDRCHLMNQQHEINQFGYYYRYQFPVCFTICLDILNVGNFFSPSFPKNDRHCINLLQTGKME